MSECSIFVVDRCVLRLVLLRFFSTLVGVLSSVKLGCTTEYVLMGFTVLLLITISSNTRSSSELEN